MSAIEEIKQKLDIVEYIGQFVTLKKVGRNFHALCPFHSEKSPSFVVSPERQLWHCFGACGEGGDVIKFVMKWENCTFGEALHILAPLANVKLDEVSVNDQAWDERLNMLHVTSLAADFFHYILTQHRIGEAARAYVASRQISTSTIKVFKMGYAPDSWDSLSKFLRAKKIRNESMVQTGLGTMGKHNTTYDRFRGRIMFPLTDARGAILGFSGRILKKDDKEAKYINTPETPLYHKRETLFGIEQASRAIRTKEEVIIMEGEFDVMLAHQFGYTQSVGIKGTALTTEQIHLLKRLTHTFIFCLDMDKAGTEAIKRGIERSQEYDLSLYVMRLSGGKDPADLLTSDPAAFKRAYKEKVSIYDFLLETSVFRHDVTTVYGQKEVIDELAPVITTITNPVVYEFFIKKTAAATGTDT
ncbi:MAG: DNA primase, partial [Candidatus Roizmanbacteria bacterium]|nr:DNA primase [Candidatus Roizmanbacteria bacterium]